MLNDGSNLDIYGEQSGIRFEGFVDGVTLDTLAGWVRCIAAPSSENLYVELVAHDNVIATAAVGFKRHDLDEVFKDGGLHGFCINIPRTMFSNYDEQCVVRVLGTDWALTWAAGIREKLVASFSRTEQEQANSGLVGRIEEVTPFSIRGWVMSLERSELPIKVSVLRNDELLVITEAKAEPKNEDSAATRYAFETTLPVHGAIAPEEFTCSVDIDNNIITFKHAPLDPLQAWGDFEVVNSTSLLGWIAANNDGSPAEIQIVCDDLVVWQGPARRRRGEHNVGFRVDLPDPHDWTIDRTVRVRSVANGCSVGVPQRIRPLDRFRANVDSAIIASSRLKILGWIQDTARPRDSVDIELLLDGVVVSTVKAAEQRADLIHQRIGSGRHGFSFDTVWNNSITPKRVDIALTKQSAIIIENIAYETDSEIQESKDGFSGKGASTDHNIFLHRQNNEKAWQGSVDTVRSDRISGWVRCDADPDNTTFLDLYIDGSYYYSTRSGRHRADVGRKFGDHGNHGFHFEIPPYLSASNDLHIKVLPRTGKALYTSEKVLKRTIQGIQEGSAFPVLQAAKISTDHAASGSAKVAYIVLNRNAAELLEEFFKSFEQHNRHSNYEILVIDHASSDNSCETCKNWQLRLNVKLFPRMRNYNFSESNNFGARNTNADILVFINNDVLVIQEISSEIINLLSDPTIGVVGTKLLDPPLHNALGSLSVQHLGVHFNCMHRTDFVQPFESRYTPDLKFVAYDSYDVPVVTGALLACRREEFLSLGGFDEVYYYGYEDVDLCLRFLQKGKRIVCANQIAAVHVRGFSRAKMGAAFAQQVASNNFHLHSKLGRFIRRSQAIDRFERPGFWTSSAPRVAFAVTEASDAAVAGDYFTALELARELKMVTSCHIVFLDQNNWYELSAIDVLIVMVDGYDLRKIQNPVPHLIRIGWARNWIDRWAKRDWAADFDSLWASSNYAAAYLEQQLALPVEVVRIATNVRGLSSGRYRSDLSSDVCFTGSYFGAPREIIYFLDPATLPFNVAIFGHGWDAVPEFSAYNRGPVPYTEMPDVYASTKIVIDDANSATKQWGSVNSRVFDALAAGALVITNGVMGVKEVFGDQLPTYSSTQELEELIWYFLENEEERRQLVSTLSAIVADNHSYTHRAASVAGHIRKLSRQQLRFSIKIAVPTARVRDEWGDYHFAVGLKRALTRTGHSVRIDCLDQWEGKHTLGDDIVLVLRGLSAYKTKPHQINLMWLISHPHDVSRNELDSYDHVFVASDKYAAYLTNAIRTSVSPLLQCTDPEMFNLDVRPLEELHEYLFIGNSRNVFRPVVSDVITMGKQVDVYGSKWEQFIPSEMIKGTYVPNTEIARHYRSASWVLNDHWDDMREQGFISNRVFDAAACGARILSDTVSGMEIIFQNLIHTYKSRDELNSILSSEAQSDLDVEYRRRLSEIVRCDHSFDKRASVIIEKSRWIFDNDEFSFRRSS